MNNNNTRSAEEIFPSGHQPPSDYERPAEHAGIVCDKDIAVAMRDGVNVVVDVYRVAKYKLEAQNMADAAEQMELPIFGFCAHLRRERRELLG